jgi:hypothetical protein
MIHCCPMMSEVELKLMSSKWHLEKEKKIVHKGIIQSDVQLNENFKTDNGKGIVNEHGLEAYLRAYYSFTKEKNFAEENSG